MHHNTSFRRASLACLLLVSTLCGCEIGPKPDNRIELISSPDGKRTVAVPPECLSWHEAANGPLENQPWPQHGCAQARNLAAQVVRTEDLAEGRPLGSADGVVTAGSIENYRAGKTRALINAKSDAPLAQMPTGTGTSP